MDTSTKKQSIHNKDRSELEKFKLFYEYAVTHQEARKKLKRRAS
jgi:hypothetical protein